MLLGPAAIQLYPGPGPANGLVNLHNARRARIRGVKNMMHQRKLKPGGAGTAWLTHPASSRQGILPCLFPRTSLAGSVETGKP